VFTIHALLFVGSILPRVEDPWPHTIGLEFPFALAGAWGILADVIAAEAPQEQRDRAIRRGGVYGFRAGAGLYAVSLVALFSFL
jgi:hypothetical protein